MIDPASLMLAVALSCPETSLIGFGKELTNIDKEAIKITKERCKELFESLPCLKSLEKIKELNYAANCGPEL